MSWHDLFSLKYPYELIRLIKNPDKRESAIVSVLGFFLFMSLLIVIVILDIHYNPNQVESIIIVISVYALLLAFLILTIANVCSLMKSNKKDEGVD
jgi:uncharacterized membrane protein